MVTTDRTLAKQPQGCYVRPRHGTRDNAAWSYPRQSQVVAWVRDERVASGPHGPVVVAITMLGMRMKQGRVALVGSDMAIVVLKVLFLLFCLLSMFHTVMSNSV